MNIITGSIVFTAAILLFVLFQSYQINQETKRINQKHNEIKERSERTIKAIWGD